MAKRRTDNYFKLGYGRTYIFFNGSDPTSTERAWSEALSARRSFRQPQGRLVEERISVFRPPVCVGAWSQAHEIGTKHDPSSSSPALSVS